MDSWLWILGFSGTLGLGLLLGIGLGGAMCALDRKAEERRRAKAVAALREGLAVAPSPLLFETATDFDSKRIREVVYASLCDALATLEDEGDDDD